MARSPMRSGIIGRGAWVVLGAVLGYVCGGVVPTVLGLAVGDAVRSVSHGMLESNPHADSYAAPALCLAAPLLAAIFARLRLAWPIVAAGFGVGVLLALVCAAVDSSYVLSALTVRDSAVNLSIRLGLASYAVAFLTTAAVGLHTASLMTKLSRLRYTVADTPTSEPAVEDP